MRIAILDMYDGTANLGLKAIKSIVQMFPELEPDVFDVRGKCEVPGLDYDIYISSGGPGSPLEGDGLWDRTYYHLMDKLWKHNQYSEDKKYVFFICHSYQMICNHLSLGSIVKRRSEAFGIYPIHLTKEGREEDIFQGLGDPFHAAEFRHWQFIEPNKKRMKNLGCKILAKEKIRPHVDLERAITAVRFSPEWIGAQFHPEADPGGMIVYLQDHLLKEDIMERHGEEKYWDMLRHAKDPGKLENTYKTIIPRFIKSAILKKKMEPALV